MLKKCISIILALIMAVSVLTLIPAPFTAADDSAVKLTVTVRDAPHTYDGACDEVCTFYVGDFITVYTYLDLSDISDWSVLYTVQNNIDYDSRFLELQLPDSEEECKEMFPVLIADKLSPDDEPVDFDENGLSSSYRGGSLICNYEPQNKVTWNFVNLNNRSFFVFGDKSCVLSAFRFKVVAPGNTSVVNTCEVISCFVDESKDSGWISLVKSCDFKGQQFYLHSSFGSGTVEVNLNDPDGNELESGYTVNWYEKDSDTVIGTGRNLAGGILGKVYQFEIVLGEELVYEYKQPPRQDVAVSKDSKVTVQLERVKNTTISGKVVDEDKRPVMGAKVTIKQLFSKQYKKETDAYTDESGAFSIQIADVTANASISSEGCRTLTIPISTGDIEQNHVDVGTLVMSKLPENIITLRLSILSAAFENQSGIESPITSANGLRFRLYNKTQNKDVEGFTIQYPSVYLEDGEVEAGDTVQIQLTDENDTFVPAEQSVKLNAQKSGECEMTLTENGKFKIGIIGGNERNKVMLFDSSGDFVFAAVVDSGYISGHLPQGNYKAVFIKKTDLLKSVSSISKLSDFGLVEYKDYLTKDIQIKSGIITDIGTVKVPVLDESRLYYTVPESTMFTAGVEKACIGRYVVMRCAYEIDGKYPCENETIRIEVPDGAEFVSNSMTLNNYHCTYSLSAGTVEIQTNQRKGVVRFYAVATADACRKEFSATLTFKCGSNTVSQPVGTASFTATAGEIDVPKITGRTKAIATGVTMANSSVTVYDNGLEVGTTTANRAGSWSLIFELVKPRSFSYHEIYAEIKNSSINGTITTDISTLHYDNKHTDLSKVTMINTAHPAGSLNPVEYRTVTDFLSPRTAVPSYNYWPAFPTFTFLVEFTNSDSMAISDVVVVTTDSSGDKTRVLCAYDQTSGLWVGTHDYYRFSDVPVSIGVNCKNVYTGYEITEEDAFEMIEDGYYEHSSSKEVEIVDLNNNEYSIDGENARIDCSDEYLTSFTPDDTYESKQLGSLKYWSKAIIDDSGAVMTLVMPIDTAKEYADRTKDEGIKKLIAGKAEGFLKIIIEMEMLDGGDTIAETGCSGCWIQKHSGDPLRDQRTAQNWGNVLHEHARLDGLSDCVPEEMIEDLHNRLNNLAQQYFHAVEVLDNCNTALEWMDRLGVEHTQIGQLFLTFFGLDFDLGFYSGLAGIARQISGLKNLTCPDDDDDDDLRPIQDPSGYVYEAVPSNRVEGVKAEAYYYDYAVDEFGVPEDTKSEILWDAGNYDQQNPLYTDANGTYAWDVPVGQWLVKFSKDGYYDTDSRGLSFTDAYGYLPVPPPQTEVNVGIVSKAPPVVDEVSVYDNEIRIAFSQYMQIDTVNSSTVKVLASSKAVTGTIKPLNAEYDYEKAHQYASIFLFVPSKPMSGKINVEINGALNYAGKKTEKKFSGAYRIAVKPERFEINGDISIAYNSGALLEVQVTPAEAGAGLTIDVESASPSIVGIANSNVVLDKNGHANVMLLGNLPGKGQIKVSLMGTDLSETLTANVAGVVPVDDRCQKVTASIASGTTVEAGTLVELATETEGAEIYYTLDGTCPCSIGSPSRLKYTKPIVIKEDTFIIAYAVKAGFEDSYTSGFNYFVIEQKPDLILGDADGDGDVTIIDATCIQRMLADIKNDTFIEAASDTDEDGDVTIIDATYIQRWLASLPANDKIGKPVK